MNDYISDFYVYPVFPTVVGFSQIQEDVSNLNSIKNFEFEKINADFYSAQGNIQISIDNYILKSFPRELQIIQDYFYRFKNDVLKYNNYNFEITTSWGVKANKNSVSHFHSHKNSFFTGIYYFEDVNDGGKLEFESVGSRPENWMIGPASEQNIYNSELFNITPKANCVVFFPSYLRHRIGSYFGESTRYSIAFNIIPVGHFGFKDCNLSIKQF